MPDTTRVRGTQRLPQECATCAWEEPNLFTCNGLGLICVEYVPLDFNPIVYLPAWSGPSRESCADFRPRATSVLNSIRVPEKIQIQNILVTRTGFPRERDLFPEELIDPATGRFKPCVQHAQLQAARAVI